MFTICDHCGRAINGREAIDTRRSAHDTKCPNYRAPISETPNPVETDGKDKTDE
jgi:hypothetical protein